MQEKRSASEQGLMHHSLHWDRGDGSDLRQVGLSFLICQTEITAVPASRGGLGFHDLTHTARRPGTETGPIATESVASVAKMKTRGLVQK